jgi:hypothetical protein
MPTEEQDKRLRNSGPVRLVATNGDWAGSTKDSALATRPAGSTPLGHFQLTNTQLAAKQNLPSIPATATFALIQNNGTQPARWRDDGPDPTASTGLRIKVGDTLLYDGNLAALELIREGDGCTLDIAYYA